MDKVVWSLEYPAENPAAGLSIDPDTGILSVPNTASSGDARVVASSAYPQTPAITVSYPIHITAIGAVTLAGPKEYRHYFRQCTKTPCTYTFTPTVQDAEGNPITEECEYSIVEPHHNPGVSITNSGKGDCVLTLRSNTVSDTLTLKASVKHAPDIIGTFTLSLVDTMVPNGDLIQREDGSNTCLLYTSTLPTTSRV